MAKLKILIDMDETLNQMLPSFKRKAVRLGFMENADVEISTWGLENYMSDDPFYDPEEMVNEIFCSKGFWYNLPIQLHARETMEKYQDKIDFYIATIPWWNSPTCLEEKKDWVRIHLPNFPIDHLIFCRDKSLLAADVMVDDSPRNLREFKATTVAMDYAYNRDIDTLYRVKDWYELDQLFSDLH